ncbi:MAG TPA: glycosyltransferase family A protein, partial [Bryobacteraceae bacterium]|nr:glycosyltransferase family A protein [Bryobacteraceae bacterium]
MTSATPSAPLVTVFTATFNRGDKIHRVFESLMAQTLPHCLFEWIVVDDGSEDDTRRVIEGFEEKADFPVFYHYQNHRGKHTAYNRAVSLARGDLFLTCDSADAFEPNGIEFLCTQWDRLSPAERMKYSGINARCRYQTGVIV